MPVADCWKSSTSDRSPLIVYCECGIENDSYTEIHSQVLNRQELLQEFVYFPINCVAMEFLFVTQPVLSNCSHCRSQSNCLSWVKLIFHLLNSNWHFISSGIGKDAPKGFYQGRIWHDLVLEQSAQVQDCDTGSNVHLARSREFPKLSCRPSPFAT